MLFVTDGIDPGDIDAFPSGGSARAALIVAPDPGAEVADWARRADVATVATTVDDADVRAVQRALATSLARAAAAEGRLQDDGWMLAVPAALLVLLWFRRGTTLRWGALLLGLSLLAPHGRPRRRYRRHPRRLVLDPRPAGPAPLRGAPLSRGGRSLRRPRVAGRGAHPRRQVPGGGRPPRADPRPAAPSTTAGSPSSGAATIPAGKAAFEAALKLDPSNADAAANLAVTKRIIAYLTEERQAEDQGAASEPPDATVADLTGDQGKPVRIDRRLPALRGRRRPVDAAGGDQARRLPQVALRHRGRPMIRLAPFVLLALLGPAALPRRTHRR